MTEIQIINSMNQSIINKITQFKNKEIKKNDLNNFMLANLCHILKTTNKIKQKNEKIIKKQNKEIKKSISKIRSYHGYVNYNPKELESIPIMKQLINPTLESYIPISEISYTTEIKFYNNNSDKCNFNESILLENNNKKEENEEKEINFQEPPITFLKNSNYIKKLSYENDLNILNLNNKNFIKNNEEDDIFYLINNDNEDLFVNEEKENQYKNNLFFELINSFDEENKDDAGNDDIELDFKKIVSFFYLDDIVLNQRLSKRNSSDAYNNLSSTSGSSSYCSRNTCSIGKISIYKEIYDFEFKNFIPIESFNKYCEQMSLDYLRYMLVIYSNAVSRSKKCFFFEEKMFLNLIKIFILKVGISSKKIFDKVIQSLLNIKKKICSFENFLKSFSYILKLKGENSVLKYIFIISLFRYGEEDINIKHINIFLQLIKGKQVFDVEIWDELNNGLIRKYDKVYSNEIGNKFKFNNILLCLETFFDKKVKINQN